MMSGQILGGADVMDATRYQQVIMFMIAASVALGVVCASVAVAFAVVDSKPMLRTEKINTKGTANSNGGKPMSGSRAVGLRSERSLVRMKSWKAVASSGE
ncbi:hypothetical protein H4R99_008209 [Coemansia sp. RSA 1722]|nr:hypothetical protein H4R99_008209 [Coemansia sp. RSA 1722]